MKRTLVLVVSAILMSVGVQFAADVNGNEVEILPARNYTGQVILELDPFGTGVVDARCFSGGESAITWYIGKIEKTVPLTREQKGNITKIIARRDQAVLEIQGKNASNRSVAIGTMSHFRQLNDKEAVAKLQKELQEIERRLTEVFKQATTDLENVLDAGQKAKLKEALLAQTIKSLTEPAVLTTEQTAQVKDLIAKGNPEGEGQDNGRRLNGRYQFCLSVQNILTAEQKAVIAKHRILSYEKDVLRRAGLTAEQSQKIEAAYDELAKTPNLDSETVAKKLFEESVALLSEEQKERMKEWRWKGKRH